MYGLCKECLKYDERFNQLGMGWLLREMYLADPKGVDAFIRQHYSSFTREALRYAIEKMPEEERTALLNLNSRTKKAATRRRRPKPEESEH